MDQDWEQVILHKKKQQLQHPQTQRINKATQNILSDDTLPPEQIDAQKRKRLFDLRIHLGMKMDELAKLCSIPPADYKDMENGKLIKAKATRYMTIIFRKYKRELESIEL
jgi:hypothetical protein